MPYVAQQNERFFLTKPRNPSADPKKIWIIRDETCGLKISHTEIDVPLLNINIVLDFTEMYNSKTDIDYYLVMSCQQSQIHSDTVAEYESKI